MSTETRTVVVRRNRDSKIPDPDSSPAARKEQNAKQKRQAALVLQGKDEQLKKDRALARTASEAASESKLMGVLTGRAAEIPIIRRNGKRGKLNVKAIKEERGEGGPRKAAARQTSGSRAARARGRAH